MFLRSDGLLLSISPVPIADLLITLVLVHILVSMIAGYTFGTLVVFFTYMFGCMHCLTPLKRKEICMILPAQSLALLRQELA